MNVKLDKKKHLCPKNVDYAALHNILGYACTFWVGNWIRMHFLGRELDSVCCVKLMTNVENYRVY